MMGGPCIKTEYVTRSKRCFNQQQTDDPRAVSARIELLSFYQLLHNRKTGDGFELFDFGNIRTAPFLLEAWENGEVAIAPAMRHFQEEKLALALFHHHLLQDFWIEHLEGRTWKLLHELIPVSWVMDPAVLPPGAVLDGPRVGGRALADWRQLGQASQKERELIIKISGFHETAWGARSVVLGSDCSREEWQEGVNRAVELAPTNLHLLQTYCKPQRVRHRVYRAADPGAEPAVVEADGRLRLCPYYFIVGGEARLSGALATFCPPDKKIIHGMQDAALLPSRLASAAPSEGLPGRR